MGAVGPWAVGRFLHTAHFVPLAARIDHCTLLTTLQVPADCLPPTGYVLLSTRREYELERQRCAQTEALRDVEAAALRTVRRELAALQAQMAARVAPHALL